MNQIGDTTTSSSLEVIHVLSRIEQWEQDAQASGSLSREQKQALDKLKVDLCASILQITESAQDQILSLINNLPPNLANTLWDDIRDLFHG